jgi:hypothetical protein
VREQMIAAGWCRNVVNRQTARIKQVFKWATENELIPATVSTHCNPSPGCAAAAAMRPSRWT